MKKIIKLLIAIPVMSALSFPLFASNMTGTATTRAEQSAMTPAQALQLLKDGNERMLQGSPYQYHFSWLAANTALEGQHPIAMILSCIDSRSSPEILFDQNIGNIFVTRTAGNVVGKKVLGGMEYATGFVGTKLIVVMGHTDCGAVGGACANLQTGNLTYLLQQIQPAVSQVKTAEHSRFNCKSVATIDAIAKQNVLDQMGKIMSDSPAIAKLVKEKKVMIVGAMHTLSTGKVVFFNMQGKNI